MEWLRNYACISSKRISSSAWISYPKHTATKSRILLGKRSVMFMSRKVDELLSKKPSCSDAFHMEVFTYFDLLKKMQQKLIIKSEIFFKVSKNLKRKIIFFRNSSKKNTIYVAGYKLLKKNMNFASMTCKRTLTASERASKRPPRLKDNQKRRKVYWSPI